MKELLQRYAAYNVWANHKLIFAMEPLEETDWFTEVPSSFNTLYKTVLHIWDAESIWWQRMRMHETFVIPSKAFDPSPKDACNGWLQQSMQWEEFVKSPQLDEGALLSRLHYKNLKGEAFAQPLNDVILHVFNHGTYHRGQLINMMHALGIKNFPATDYVHWARTVLG